MSGGREYWDQVGSDYNEMVQNGPNAGFNNMGSDGGRTGGPGNNPVGQPPVPGLASHQDPPPDDSLPPEIQKALTDRGFAPSIEGFSSWRMSEGMSAGTPLNGYDYEVLGVTGPESLDQAANQATAREFGR